MTEPATPIDKLLHSLNERAKELNCLYQVEQVLNRVDLPLEEAFQAVVDAVPPGWQYPDVCRATLRFGDRFFSTGEFEPSQWVQGAEVVVQDEVVGSLNVYYLEERPREAIGPFLKEEQRLIQTIADRVAHFILYHRLRHMRLEWEEAKRSAARDQRESWRGPIELLRSSDRELYLRIARKLVNHLCWIGVSEAQQLLDRAWGRTETETGEVNYPGRLGSPDERPLLSGEPFELASRHLSDGEIMSLIQHWITEDKASFLPKLLLSARTSLTEIAEGLRRFQHVVAEGAGLSEATSSSLRVNLIRRFLSEHLELIGIAKDYLDTGDFVELLDRVILSADSHGRLGGKTAGLVMAEHILRKAEAEGRPVGPFSVPKSWYVASDELRKFVVRNELEDVLSQKYKEVAQVRQEYPNVIQLFKHSRFPADVVRGLSVALDDFGDVPLIVRSSSLLEDRLGSAFSGKYKSLFLANRGSKQERLAALLDAVAEVYASVFGPDPIEYRRERGLLDFHEEMAILIQEVVGRQVGDYYFPAFAGVAFSHNEFCWSPKIRREDGVVRLVAGLGTRAVDRVSEDYPVLAVPGQPELRVNASVDEQVRYTPRHADVINLSGGRFETVPIGELLRHTGTRFPAFDKVFSVLREDTLMRPVPLLTDPERDDLVATFDGLLSASPFVHQVRNILAVLEEAMGTPVDIEFASDGDHLYLLQCRPQSHSDEASPAAIPKDLPEQDIVFAAHRYVSNGLIPNLTHVVYVDPEAYAHLSSTADLRAVGLAVSKLNKLLPKRQFILMGPGRWGSRGDIRLGVSVTYSDINNTAMLVEIARTTGNYRPDLSFGTHFFQDLVEASIRYLPLYPEDDSQLNERFLRAAPNLLASMLPEHQQLAGTVRVIDVPAASNGRILRVLMNSELAEAVAVLVSPDDERTAPPPEPTRARRHQESYWRWRLQMAERIAAEVDPKRFGVRAMYILGSTKNATAGPSSDIDLLVHFAGSEDQQRELSTWFEGWSLALAEMNYLRTGYRTGGLLDVHLVTDAEIAARTSWAAKIGAVTDAARELELGGARQAV